MTVSLLLVEDTPSLRMIYSAMLRERGFAVDVAGTGEEGIASFVRKRHDVVLLDLMLPDRNGMDVMRECLRRSPDTPIIVITAEGSIDHAVTATRAGAAEFIVKPFTNARLLTAIERALDPGEDAEEVVTAEKPGYESFIGESPVMRAVYAKIDAVGRSNATVFISGESGTGKELCAQAIHDVSLRADKPFVPLNCGAIPSDLLESEVFGHLKGSFTGAIADKPGAAAVADGGTLFLDEICEMDLALQTKLLRFLETSSITPVGATRAKHVDVRILCATNRDPLEEVRRGRFREDLYYRLHVVPIHVPPLRDRGEDVLLIAKAMLARFSRDEGRSFRGFDDAVKQVFLRHRWPGNVRQLLNLLWSVVILNDGPLITCEMLPQDFLDFDPPPRPAEQHARSSSHPRFAGRTLAEIERQAIEDAIARHNGSVTRAARELDVSPSTIYRKREAWSAEN